MHARKIRFNLLQYVTWRSGAQNISTGWIYSQVLDFLLSFLLSKITTACDIRNVRCLKNSLHSYNYSHHLTTLMFLPSTKRHCHFTISRNVWQFSLEVIIHHKLLGSPYRTRNPEKADLFYIPYYAAIACFCLKRKEGKLGWCATI